ncbi:MAG TPA: tetratricopeptide repeat protein [Bryobacteraceae bacterium]|nr:tetratricopeptide repeat protein [Bryobacteraceae bacterium]
MALLWLVAPLVHAEPGYVDSAVCGRCHSRIAESYRRTGMGRSFSPPGANQPEGTYYHPASDTYFQMIRRDGRYFQLQYQIGFDGKRTNELEKQVDYVVGSGNHSRTYLHRTGRNTLVELPLAWYAENGGSWAMNPGYDRPDHQGFRRVIGEDCLFCHNAYPEIPNGASAAADPVFAKLPGGIDCQRCHGPGEKHVRTAQSPGAARDAVRASIVNPARLTPDRRMEVCLQCHLETTSFSLPNAIVRFERGPFSYRPGEPLGAFRLHFDKDRDDDRFEIAGAAYRLRKSQCFLQSAGALECTTCHDPHTAGSAPPAHYVAACRQCHGAPFNALVAAGAHTRSPDCTGCHMPKRRTDDAVHVVMTDHYIQRRPPARDLLAPLAEKPPAATAYRGAVVLYYPKALPQPEDELYLAIAQVRQQSNLAEGIPRLAAALEKYRPERAEYYLQLAHALRDNGQLDRAVAMYEEALRRDPQGVSALQNLGLSLLSLRQHARALDVLKHAAELVPQDAASRQLLGTAYVEQGKTSEAIAAFQQALSADAGFPEAHNSLGAIWFQTRDWQRAEPELREAIRLQPAYPQAHNNLANLLAATNRFEEARYHFERALQPNADNASTRYDYAIALARMRRLDEAQQQLETALRQSPNFAEASELLGTVLASKGRLPQAIRQYREALRIRPAFARAQLHLGEALADSGDVTAALPYLRQAAGSTDPAVRDEARARLAKLQ